MTNWSKLSRAYEHLSHIDDRIRWFLDMKPYRFVREYKEITDYVGGDRFFQVVLHAPVAPPPELPALIGDCLANLRSSLDHLMYDIALRHTGRTDIVDQRRLQFAIYDKPAQFASWKGEMVANNLLPPKVLDLLESVQPYSGWDGPPPASERHCESSALWVLNALVNADKHRAFMPVTHLFVKGLTMVRNDADGGGRMGISVTGAYKHNEIVFPYGWHPDARDDDVRLDGEIVPDVALSEEWPAGGRPVSLLLHYLGKHIRDEVFPVFDPFL